MRRRVIVYSLVLILSFILSYVVAVCFAWFGERPQFGFGPNMEMPDLGESVSLTERDISRWRRHRSSDWPEIPEFGMEHRFVGVRFLNLHHRTETDEFLQERRLDHVYIVWTYAYGWPWHSVGCESWVDYVQTNPFTYDDDFLRIGVLSLPSRLIWRGMICNSLIYAAVIIGLVEGGGATRRLSRRFRGRCLRCGYDLRRDFDHGCPECGWNRSK